MSLLILCDQLAFKRRVYLWISHFMIVRLSGKFVLNLLKHVSAWFVYSIFLKHAATFLNGMSLKPFRLAHSYIYSETLFRLCFVQPLYMILAFFYRLVMLGSGQVILFNLLRTVQTFWISAFTEASLHKIFLRYKDVPFMETWFNVKVTRWQRSEHYMSSSSFLYYLRQHTLQKINSL